MNFSRDRGFTNSTYPNTNLVLFSSPHEVTVYYGESLFVYGISSILHFLGFLTAMYVFRFADNEQLQSLAERVFLIINVPNKLFYYLWLHMLCGISWLIVMTLFVVIMEQNQLNFLCGFGIETSNHTMENLIRVN